MLFRSGWARGVPSCGPRMLDSSVADWLTRLTLKLLEKVRQLGTRVFNSLLQKHSFER